MAAKGYRETDRQVRELLADIRQGSFRPVYLLMGEEPYYVDLLADALLEHVTDEATRDFNQTVLYGAETDAETVVTAARRYPMMADRQLVMLKEAQAMKTLDQLAIYCEHPLDTTVLAVVLHGASADKRKSFYKAASKIGVVVESMPLRDYELSGWIVDYYRERGLSIAPDAAALLAESAGTVLGKIVLETDKLIRRLPEGTREVTARDIEENVGFSREFSIFELSKALSLGNAQGALKIAARIGQTPHFALPAATSALYGHFSKVLRYAALLARTPSPSPAEKAAALAGVPPFFYREYEAAARRYPLRKCMAVIALLRDYDYRGKGGGGGAATPEELLTELVFKILNV